MFRDCTGYRCFIMVCVVCCAFYPNDMRGLSEGKPNYIWIRPEVHTGEPVVWCCAVVVLEKRFILINGSRYIFNCFVVIENTRTDLTAWIVFSYLRFLRCARNDICLCFVGSRYKMLVAFYSN